MSCPGVSGPFASWTTKAAPLRESSLSIRSPWLLQRRFLLLFVALATQGGLLWRPNVSGDQIDVVGKITPPAATLTDSGQFPAFNLCNCFAVARGIADPDDGGLREERPAVPAIKTGGLYRLRS
jgi:hypothetical protein